MSLITGSWFELYVRVLALNSVSDPIYLTWPRCPFRSSRMLFAPRRSLCFVPSIPASFTCCAVQKPWLCEVCRDVAVRFWVSSMGEEAFRWGLFGEVPFFCHLLSSNLPIASMPNWVQTISEGPCLELASRSFSILNQIRNCAGSCSLVGHHSIFCSVPAGGTYNNFPAVCLQVEGATVFYSVLAASMSERRLNVSYETAFMIGHLALTDIHDGILLSSIIFRRPYVLGRVASIFYLPDDE